MRRGRAIDTPGRARVRYSTVSWLTEAISRPSRRRAAWCTSGSSRPRATRARKSTPVVGAKAPVPRSVRSPPPEQRRPVSRSAYPAVSGGAHQVGVQQQRGGVRQDPVRQLLGDPHQARCDLGRGDAPGSVRPLHRLAGRAVGRPCGRAGHAGRQAVRVGRLVAGPGAARGTWNDTVGWPALLPVRHPDSRVDRCGSSRSGPP